MTRRFAASLLALPLTVVACDSGKKPAPTPAPEPAAQEKPAEKAPAKDEAKPKELALPWMHEQVSEAFQGGVTLLYKQSGKNAKGKNVEDDFKCEVKKITTKEVGVVCNGVKHPSKDKGANEVAMAAWSNLSPFFSVSRAETELVERAQVTVPAGTFETVKVELKGFFGNRYTVWMIDDKPGVYAKVIQHPNATAEGDKTELTYELAELNLGAAK